ncbi:MAG: hypothetical protein V7L00_22240 [Nostoc sp.]|uniref:hypothetical protein n=1 Tax=Nostoc sp. TaxID=1180 RepID=UPI002FFC46CD
MLINLSREDLEPELDITWIDADAREDIFRFFEEAIALGPNGKTPLRSSQDETINRWDIAEIDILPALLGQGFWAANSDCSLRPSYLA